MKKKNSNILKKIKIKYIVIAVIVIALAYILWSCFNSGNQQAAVGMTQGMDNVVDVVRRDINSEVSSTGVIEAKDTYNITALVSGEVIEANFEVGDKVEKDQILYKIDVSSAKSELDNANNSLNRANKSLEDVNKDYGSISNKYSGRTYKSNRSGYIKEVSILAGDKVSTGTKLANVYNDTTMKLNIPFLNTQAVQIQVGSPATIILSDTNEELSASVASVSSRDEVLDGGRLVRYVSLQAENPGGLTTDTSAFVKVGDFTSAAEAKFAPLTDTEITADLPSTVDVEKVLVNPGDYVKEGTPIFTITSESYEKMLRSYEDNVDNAKERVENAQLKLESANESIDKYTISSPIEGQVITKNYKVGDKIGSNSGKDNASTTLASIYDMNEYTFKMSVDEVDISKIKVGQEVRVESEAFKDKTYTGTVSNISLESTNNNGVSTYPVTVKLNEKGELLPGMNVQAYILLGTSKNALCIPSAALMRGNQVYIQDENVTTTDGIVPIGFRAVDVKTGLANANYVEILSGLSEGDKVYVENTSSDTDQYEEGEYYEEGGQY
jgi:efflux transporter, RND family, MFP subunit